MNVVKHPSHFETIRLRSSQLLFVLRVAVFLRTWRLSLVISALRFATRAHADVRRKYSGELYIYHPMRVALCVAGRPRRSTHLVAAMLLHDVVEDTDTTQAEVDALFGSIVGNIVSDLTDISRLSDGNRKVRKAIDRDHTAQASAKAKVGKLADILDNAPSMIGAPKFAVKWAEEKMELLTVLQGVDDGLFRETRRAVQELHAAASS